MNITGVMRYDVWARAFSTRRIKQNLGHSPCFHWTTETAGQDIDF
jgi:hypothetical protein